MSHYNQILYTIIYRRIDIIVPLFCIVHFIIVYINYYCNYCAIMFFLEIKVLKFKKNKSTLRDKK